MNCTAFLCGLCCLNPGPLCGGDRLGPNADRHPELRSRYSLRESRMHLPRGVPRRLRHQTRTCKYLEIMGKMWKLISPLHSETFLIKWGMKLKHFIKRMITHFFFFFLITVPCIKFKLSLPT